MTDVVIIGGLFRELVPGEKRAERRPGGSGFVAALTAAALGVDVALVGFVGEADVRALSRLRRARVDVDAVQVLPGEAGIFSFVDEMDRRAPRPMYRAAETVPHPAPPPNIPSAPVVLAFGFPDFDPRDWIAAAVATGGVLMWDRQGWLSRTIEHRFFEHLPVARRVYIANAAEMRDDAGAVTNFRALLQQPPPPFDAAVIKCGRWGTLVIERDKRVDMVGAYVAEVSSAIGSGDSFAGALSAALATDPHLTAAARVGAAAASLFVEWPGNAVPPDLRAGVTQVLAMRRQCFVSPARLEEVRVYLAGPWFSVAEAMLIEEMEAVLEHLGLHVTSPRRDLGVLDPGAPPDEIRKIGERDYAAIDASDVVVALLDGDDPGTLMEVGWAAKAGKPIIALRSAVDAAPQPMRAAAQVRVATDIRELQDEITAWVRETYGTA